jgi:hypothetical protein
MQSNLEAEMKRTPIRVEPISTYLERRRKGPIYPLIVADETVYVSAYRRSIRRRARSSGCHSRDNRSWFWSR